MLVKLQCLTVEGEFFTAQQQERLRSLMERWRSARDTGTSLPPEERSELDALLGEKVRATTPRTAAMLRELER